MTRPERPRGRLIADCADRQPRGDAAVGLAFYPACAVSEQRGTSYTWRLGKEVTVEHFAYAALGALVLYLFGPAKGQDFLDRRFPNWPRSGFKSVCSLFVYVVIGGVVAGTLAAPIDQRQALLAGWSWVGLLETTKG
jgi:hypothetical protein